MIKTFEALTADHLVDAAAQGGLALQHVLPPRRQAVAPGMLATPLPVVHGLWKSTVQELGDPLLPLRLGTRPTEQARSIVAMAGMVSTNLGEGVARVVRYWPLVTDAFRWTLTTDRDRVIMHSALPEAASLGWRCSLEFHLADLIHAAQILTNGAFRPRELRLAHDPPPRIARAFEELIGGRVRTGCGRVELIVDRAQMDLAFEPRVPPPLASLVVALAEQSLERVARPPTLVERVCELLEEAPDEFTLARVAKRLGMSTRTLHRRLDDHGTSFQALLDEARRCRAELLLAEPTSSAEQVADALGLSRRGFFRAFRRWTGATPAAYRRAALTGEAP